MMPLIEYFYLDGHLTNLVLFPLFGIGLFLIIRFIELVDRGYFPYISNVTCKKCRTRMSLIHVCKHTRYSILTPISISLFGFSVFVMAVYYFVPYFKSHPYVAIEQIFNATGTQIKYQTMFSRISNYIDDTPNQVGYYVNGTQVTYRITDLEISIYYLIDSLTSILSGVLN
jgi:hypothetical protein